MEIMCIEVWDTLGLGHMEIVYTEVWDIFGHPRTSWDTLGLGHNYGDWDILGYIPGY